MLKYFLTIILLQAFSVKGQNLVGRSFITIVNNVRVYLVDSPYSNNGREFYYVKKGTKFIVDRIDKDNNVVISFWKYKNSDSKNAGEIPKPNHLNTSEKSFTMIRNRPKQLLSFGQNSIATEIFEEAEQLESPRYIDAWAENRAFILSLADLNQLAVPFFGEGWSFNWGVMTLPVKIRFGNKDDRYFNFEEKINLGFSAGAKYQIAGRVEQYINTLAGFSVGSVKTDSVSLKPGYYDSEHLSGTAFSFDIGVLYQYETFQIGLFLGKDFLASTLGRQWRYQGKTWVGLAIGVSLFARQDGTQTTGNN